MIPLLKSEARKLLTVRSTYIVTALALLFSGLIIFWVFGYKGLVTGSDMLMEASKTAVALIAVAQTVIAVLFVGHEYRYNTIMYTLTSSNNRLKIFLAKTITVVWMSTILTVIALLFGAVMAWLGTVAAGSDLMQQTYHIWDLLWRSVVYGVTFALMAMFLVFLFRNIAAAIIGLLVVPSFAEGLLMLQLKENSKYLPFTAHDNIMAGSALKPGMAALVFLGYLMVAGAVAGYLFWKRDAN